VAGGQLPVLEAGASPRPLRLALNNGFVKRTLESPQPMDGHDYYDGQAAVIFELRHFPRHYDFTQRWLLAKEIACEMD